MIRKEDIYDDEFIELRKQYRNCFKDYPNVLNHLLSDMGTFQRISADPGEVALRNYGVHLLEIIGAYDEDGIENILRSYIKLPLQINTPLQEEK